MANVFAYDAEGKLLRSGQGFFISADGRMLTAYSLIKDATKVEVVDAKGNRANLVRVVGANSSVDLIAFSTDMSKQLGFLAPSSAPAAKNEKLFLLNYTTSKKTIPATTSVTSVEAYNDYKYYHISASNDSRNLSCPLVNEAGNVVAIVQRDVKEEAVTACAIDVRFGIDLSITATSALNADLRDLRLPVAIPTSEREALTYIYMLGAADTARRAQTLHDFIAAFPENADGYMNRANFRAEKQDFKGAEADFAIALQKAENADATDSLATRPEAVHYSMSTLFYRSAYMLSLDSTTAKACPGWTFEKALSEAEKAHAARANTLYLQQQGTCLFALKRYADAHKVYMSVVNDKAFATTANYYAAARSLELSKGDSLQVLALLDSAVVRLPQNAPAASAQIYLERTRRLINAGRHRDAVMDLNKYEQIVGPRNLNAQFYYQRYLQEVEARMFQQALDDIHTVIATSPAPLPYRLEEAFLLLRVGEYDRALAAAESLLADLPESPDCYKVMGLAHGESGRKAKALPLLQKARELGDTSVEPFIKKYSGK